jgi:predicted histidine transporter YuiF (NhaC family)
MLILRPYFCYEILFQLKIVNNSNIKTEIIEKLNWLISKIHTNAYIITNKSTLKDFRTEKTVNFMNELIDILIENNRENALSDKLLKFIEKIIFLSGLKSKYIKHVLEKLAEISSKEKYDGNKFVLVLKLLNVNKFKQFL